MIEIAGDGVGGLLLRDKGRVGGGGGLRFRDDWDQRGIAAELDDLGINPAAPGR